MVRVPFLAVVVALLVLYHGQGEETQDSCSVVTPKWSRNCELNINCPIVTEGYVKNIQHAFICEDNTTLWWSYPPNNSALNMVMWFEGGSSEYKVCLNNVPYWNEGTYNVVHYDLNSDDANGPVLDANDFNKPNPDPDNFRQPCVRSSSGYVRFRVTSSFQGYGMIVPLKILPIDAGDTEVIETDGNPPEVLEPESCSVRDDLTWLGPCEVMIADCPSDSIGKVELQLKNDCNHMVLDWHYTWSDYLDVTTWLPGQDQDFKFCLHGATSRGNMTYYSEETGTSVTVSHPFDELPAGPDHCFNSKDGYAKFKLSVDQIYYVVWFNVSYTDVHDISGSNKVQCGVLLQTVFSTFILYLVKQM